MVSANHLNRYQMDDKWIHAFNGYALVYVFLCKLTSISLWPGSSAQDGWMLASLNVFASLWILSLSHSTNMQKKKKKKLGNIQAILNSRLVNNPYGYSERFEL